MKFITYPYLLCAGISFSLSSCLPSNIFVYYNIIVLILILMFILEFPCQKINTQLNEFPFLYFLEFPCQKINTQLN